MDCKNCGHTVDGAYCSQCGQSSKVGRINLANFLSEVSETLFKVDKGFFFTLRELSTQPGASIRAFLDGKRKTHFKPIAYALTLSTFYFLSTELTHQNTWLSDLVSGWFAGALEKDEKAELPSAVNWFMRNYAYATLCLLPIFSLASYIAFFKAGRNYLEHLVFNAYVSGHQALIYFTFAIMGAIVKGDVTRDFIVLISFVMAIVYAFWAFWQFFRQSSRVINLLSTSLTYVLYLFLSTGLLALSGLLV